MAGEPFLTKTCLYTLTPDRDFVVDALPEHPGVHVLLGSAHAYKFASVLGRVIVERALDGSSPSDPELAGSGSTARSCTRRSRAAPSSCEGSEGLNRPAARSV